MEKNVRWKCVMFSFVWLSKRKLKSLTSEMIQILFESATSDKKVWSRYDWHAENLRKNLLMICDFWLFCVNISLFRWNADDNGMESKVKETSLKSHQINHKKSRIDCVRYIFKNHHSWIFANCFHIKSIKEEYNTVSI